MERVETLVIGAGQAGLSASYHLKQLGAEHLVVDAGQVGETWRSRRWDSFTLVTPNWTVQLPGMEPLPDPDAFTPREGVVDLLSGIAATNELPIRTGVAVTKLGRATAGHSERFLATTSTGYIAASNVIVATGWFRTPKVPAWALDLDPAVHQLPMTDYRNPEALPPGGVLIVGSAQSGCQIAEDLQIAGRDVWLSTGKSGRVPRRYRTWDGMRWWQAAGGFEWTEDKIPDPRGRFGPNPHLSGARGGHSINLHRFARDGIHLLGHVTGGEGHRLMVAPDLPENLARADGFAANFVKEIDEHIEAQRLDLPPADHDDPANSDDHLGSEGYEVPIRESLDLRAEGIGTIIWATGLLPDHSWVQLPIFNDAGHPIHDGGVTQEPGLAFVGLRFQRMLKSDLFYGVGEDAQLVVERLLAVSPDRMPA